MKHNKTAGDLSLRLWLRQPTLPLSEIILFDPLSQNILLSIGFNKKIKCINSLASQSGKAYNSSKWYINYCLLLLILTIHFFKLINWFINVIYQFNNIIILSIKFKCLRHCFKTSN